MSKMKHSEAYFGDERDFWWNRDFLELMAKRWDLKSVSSALDVGCGVGHWGQLLSHFLR
jgi:cyclopropane fatty-acyl-phospholipid synthase-like methyltransferase